MDSAQQSLTSYPRIYEIFPRLAGKVRNWNYFVDEAKQMQFDWIWVNPFHLTCQEANASGLKGSLYSVSDHTMLDAAFSEAEILGQPVPNDERLALAKAEAADGVAPQALTTIREADSAAIGRFLEHSHDQGMKVMADLVLNHLALDHPLVSAETEALAEFYRIVSTATPEQFTSSKDPSDTVNTVRVDLGAAGALVYEESVEHDGVHEPRLLRVTYPDGTSVVPKFRRYVREKETHRGWDSLEYHTEPSGVRWDDVAQFNFSNPEVREFCLPIFKDLIKSYIDLGFDGFRCDAAYQIPGKMWGEIIDSSREYAAGRNGKELTFLAEVVGGIDKSAHLVEAGHDGKKGVFTPGFDFATSSAHWWWDQPGHVRVLQKGERDKDWHTDEQELLYKIARHGPLGFPESHDMERVALKYDDPVLAAKALARDYAIAALGSNGVFMPMGYERGLRSRLTVFENSLPDWSGQLRALAQEGKSVDIREFIAEINQVKQRLPVTPHMTKQVLPTATGQDALDENIVLIRRQFRGEAGDADAGSLIIAVNRDLQRPMNIDANTLATLLHRKPGEMKVLMPSGGQEKYVDGVELGSNARIIYVPPVKKHGLEAEEAKKVLRQAAGEFNMKWTPLGAPGKETARAM
ncbi:MAG: hypothetical protein IT567_06520 [Alphaproteobacteria bacterium]|nr:hypothetical protein [Alphaproteobacteria bacterium]